MNNYICPKCGSDNTRKDRDRGFGEDTGDRICQDCNHEGWYKDFLSDQKLNKKEDKSDSEEQK